MSKVICDVCGTAYPETATSCPICGSAKTSGEQTAAGSTPAESQGASYAYVKGGRFSKKNVRRRNQKGGRVQETRVPAADRQGKTVAEKNAGGDDEKLNKGLIAVVVILLLAIVAVVIFICVKFFAPNPDILGNTDPTPTVNQEPTPTGDPTEAPTGGDIICTGVTLSKDSIAFTELGSEVTLIAVLTPENTTDTVVFASADETVAIVTADGVVRAVGYGDTTITVTCGGIVRQCKVSVVSDFTFEFNTSYFDEYTNQYDVTIQQGSTWKAYKGTLTVPASEITWISEDETVAVIDNGIVTAVSAGRTLIHAQYGGKTYTCIFRCSAPQGGAGNEFASTPSDTPFRFRWASGPDAEGKYDASLRVGETWPACPDGIDPASVVWSIVNVDANDTNVYATVENGVVTAVASNGGLPMVELHAVYEGAEFICILRIRKALN